MPMLMALSITLVFAAGAFAAQPLDCYYAARPTAANRKPEMSIHQNCAIVSGDGSVRIRTRHLKALYFNADGLATLNVKGRGWFYVRRNGHVLEVLSIDNGADEFSEGLVRGRSHGKVAFFDRSFRMVLLPAYDFAWAFENGRALVCSGCKEKIVADDPENHHTVTGGLWGYIDHHGKEVIPVKYSRGEALRRDELMER
ncbi:MAG TPA: WG repeat-containing protein [Thermoanaerobaculia bacterium]|nr:WG repeat-containing protein [Thermoanaerobaculia bacterium]